ncbi:MAG: hypothetical protein K0U12_07045, partial [Gammaproteobacteria bacterium]|nr:hypothetical protein [Gammaproteobacteria bacterium]
MKRAESKQKEVKVSDKDILSFVHQLGGQLWKQGFSEDGSWRGRYETEKQEILPKHKTEKFAAAFENWPENIVKWLEEGLFQQAIGSIIQDIVDDNYETSEEDLVEEIKDFIL